MWRVQSEYHVWLNCTTKKNLYRRAPPFVNFYSLILDPRNSILLILFIYCGERIKCNALPILIIFSNKQTCSSVGWAALALCHATTGINKTRSALSWVRGLPAGIRPCGISLSRRIDASVRSERQRHSRRDIYCWGGARF